MEYLQDGDIIKLASWRHNYATVRTLKAWLAERPNRFAMNDAPRAWANKSATVITNDPNHAERHRTALASARIVAIGEMVSIDGKPYTVSVPRGNVDEARNSDPIHFHPAPEAI